MMIKDSDGVEHKVAGTGTTALGIVGTVLGATALSGVLNGNNGLGGLFGCNNGYGNRSGYNGNYDNGCYVTECQFYNQQISDIREMYNNLITTNSRICDLESRLSGDEISIAKNFEIEQIRSGYENKLWDAKLQAATCDFVKAQHYLSPCQLADPYHGNNNYIATYSFPAGYSNCGGWGNFGNFGFNGGGCNGWGTFNNGCGCGCNF